MTRSPFRPAILLVLAPQLAFAAAAPSAPRGASVFQARCALCHSVEPGAGGGQGPNLRGVVGRKAATTDFSDSAALTRWGRTWTPELLDRYLIAPTKLVPGTTMVQKVTDRTERAD
ncbi:MAG TPA: c-type cytochrome, partial [Myxococcaceae bacterium]|nr:c-type cytochrome [Myxococcaceae bacterium]